MKCTRWLINLQMKQQTQSNLRKVDATTSRKQKKIVTEASRSSENLKLPKLSQSTLNHIPTPLLVKPKTPNVKKSGTSNFIKPLSSLSVSPPLLKSKDLTTEDVKEENVNEFPKISGAEVQSSQEIQNQSSLQDAVLNCPQKMSVHDANVLQISCPLGPTEEPVNILSIIDPKLLTGKVKIIYEMYNEEFDISEGSTTAAVIDDLYCLSFSMPNCSIHLSTFPPAEKRLKDIAECRFDEIYVKEDPSGTYHGLKTGQVYYIYVDQHADQLYKDQQAFRERLALVDPGPERDQGSRTVRDDGRVLESCSCVYGNPCVIHLVHYTCPYICESAWFGLVVSQDEYGCKDWDNRFAISKSNGWKGF